MREYRLGKGDANVYDSYEVSDGNRVLRRADYSYNGYGERTLSIDRVTLPLTAMGPASLVPADGDIVAEYVYDADGNLTDKLMRDTSGGSPKVHIAYAYQSGGSLVSKWFFSDAALAEPFAWKAMDRDRDGNTGLVYKERDGAGVETAYEYDGLGRVTRIDPAGGIEEVTDIVYPTIVTAAVHQGPGSTYDCNASDSGDFVLTCYGYDGLGRLVSTRKRMNDGHTAPGRQTTTYDLVGRVTRRSEWFWDGDTPAETIFDYGDPATYGNQQAQRTNDPFGRVRVIDAPDSKKTETTYFGTSEIVTVRGVAGDDGTILNPTTTYLKDVWGRLVGVLAAAESGANALYTYDLTGQLLEADLYGNGSNSAQVRRYEYDALGRLRASESPETGTDVIEGYDVSGNVLKRVDASGNVTFMTYDGAGRPASVSWQAYQPTGGPTPPVQCLQANTYDEAAAGHSGGRLTKVESCNEQGQVVHTRSLYYEEAEIVGRLSMERNVFQDWPDGNGPVIELSADVEYDYNSLGLISQVKYPEGPSGAGGAFTVQYVYSNGLPTLVREMNRDLATCPEGETECAGELVLVDYARDGSLEKVTSAPTRANAVVDLIERDSQNRPERMRLCRYAGAQCDNLMDGEFAIFDTGTYSYDGAGNIAGIGVNEYGYDEHNRLVRATVSDSDETLAQSYVYDMFGNMTEKVLRDDVGAELAHDLYTVTDQITGWNANKLQSHQAGTNLYVYEYDPRGNLLRDDTHTYELDGLNRLTAVRPISGVSARELARYSYEGNGNRIIKQVLPSGLRTYYVRDASGRLLSEFRRTAVVGYAPEWSKHYVYLDDRLVALRENTLPPPPVGLSGAGQVFGTQGVIGLWWQANPAHEGSPTVMYQVYRSPNTTPPTWVSRGTTTVVNFQENVTKGTWYKYVVTALDADGHESYGSDVLVIRAGTIKPVPNAPANLRATPALGRVMLSWDRNLPSENVVGYHVYRRTSGSAVRITTTPLSHPSFLDRGLLDGTGYLYSVSAVNTVAMESSRSAEKAATPNDYTPPGSPLDLTATETCDGTGDVVLSWAESDPAAGVTHYLLDREPPFPEGPEVEVGLGGAYRDTSTDPDTIYVYTLSAVDALGNHSEASRQERLRTHVPQGTYPAPDAPFAKSGDGTVTLRVPPPGVSVLGLRVYRKRNVDIGCEAYQLAGVASASATFVDLEDAAVQNDVAYDYAVSYVVDGSMRQTDLSRPALATPVGRPWSVKACFEDLGPLAADRSNWEDGAKECGWSHTLRRLLIRWQHPMGRKYQPLEANSASGDLGYLTGYRVYQHVNKYPYENGFDIASMLPVAVDYEKMYCTLHPDQGCEEDEDCPTGDSCAARSPGGRCAQDYSACTNMYTCNDDFNEECLWKPGYCYKGSQTTCSQATDCPAPMRCINERCACITDTDCPGLSSLGKICRDGACINTSATCLADGDCPAGQLCGWAAEDPYSVTYQDKGVNTYPGWVSYYESTCYAINAIHKVFADGQWVTVESGLSDNFDADAQNKSDRCVIGTPDPCVMYGEPDEDDYVCSPQGEEPPKIGTPTVTVGVDSVTVTWEPPTSCEPDLPCGSGGSCPLGQFCLPIDDMHSQCRYTDQKPCSPEEPHCDADEVCVNRESEIDGYLIYGSEPFGSFKPKYLENRRYHARPPFPIARVDKGTTSVTLGPIAPIRQSDFYNGAPVFAPAEMSFRVATYDRGGRIARLSEPSALASPTGVGGVAPPASLKNAVWFTYDPTSGRDGIKLVWLPGAAYSGLTGYRVWRSQEETGTYCALISAVDPVTGIRSVECKLADDLGAGEVSTAVPSFIDSSADTESVYFYNVSALAGAESARSTTISAMVLPRVSSPLSPPARFKAEAPRGTATYNGSTEWDKIYLTWCQNPPQEGVTSYRVYRSAASMGPYTNAIASLPAECMDGWHRCEIGASGQVTVRGRCTGGATQNCCNATFAGGAGSCKVVDMTLTQSTEPSQPVYYYVVTAVRQTQTGVEESPFSAENQGRPNYTAIPHDGSTRIRTDLDNPPDVPCSLDMSWNDLDEADDPVDIAPVDWQGAFSTVAGTQVDQCGSSAPYRTIGVIVGGITPRARPRFVFYHVDHLGSPRALTDELGAVVSRHQYLPFGEEFPYKFQESTNRREFTGQERDPETGLDYMMARYYGSTLARFMSPDPLPGHLELPQTLNKYIYAGNNPLRFVDPDGRDFYIKCSEKNTSTCDENGHAGTTDENGKFTPTIIHENENHELVDQDGTKYSAEVNSTGIHFTKEGASKESGIGGVWKIGSDPVTFTQHSGDLTFTFTFSGNPGFGQDARGTFEVNGSTEDAGKALRVAGLNFDGHIISRPGEDWRSPEANHDNATHFNFDHRRSGSGGNFHTGEANRGAPGHIPQALHNFVETLHLVPRGGGDE